MVQNVLQGLLDGLFEAYLEITLILVVGLLLLVLWFLFRLASGRREQVEPGAVARNETPLDAIDLTLPPPRPDLRRSFARALAAERRAYPGRGIARRPWILVLGPSLSGKTTLLARSGLGIPFGQPRQSSDTHPGINWWALEEGIALDIVGSDVLRLDGSSSDGLEWKNILRRIRRARRRRPIDGIVLTLPAHAFLDEAKPLGQRLAEASRRGALLHRKLAEAQRILGMRLPVYLLVSHCDRIPGFGGLFTSQSGLGVELDQMMGWSNPASPNAPYSTTWIGQAFAQLRADLDGFQLRRLARSAALSSMDSVSADAVSFPNRLAELEEPLRIYANQLFGDSASSEAAILRGVYFCGGGGTTDSSQPSPQPGPGGGQLELPPRVAFVGDLLERKVFAEAGIARPSDTVLARTRIWRGALASFAVIALAWAGWGLWRGSMAVRSVVDGIEPLPRTIAAGLDAGRAAGAADRLFAASSSVPSFGLRSVALPSSWFSPLPTKMNRAIETGFLRLALEPSREILEQRTETLIALQPLDRPNIEAKARIRAVDGYPELQFLDRLTTDLDRIDRAIARYQLFSRNGVVAQSDALDEFNNLASATLNLQLRPRPGDPPNYFARRLASIDALPFDYQHLGFSRRLERKIVDQTQRFYDALFTNNPLAADMDALSARWVEGGLGNQLPASEVARYRQLQQALDVVRRDLTAPELQWTAADSLDLGPRFDEILRRIGDSPFLGPAVRDRLMREAVSRFRRLRDDVLAVYATSDTGVLLLREDQKWTLSPRLEEVASSLTQLLGESFFRRPSLVSAPCTLRTINNAGGGNLLWKSKPLEEAVNLYQAYQQWAFESADPPALPEPLRDSAPEVAAAAIAQNLLCLLASAQSFEPALANPAPDVVEDRIRLQVQNLQTVEKPLEELLTALRQLELWSGQSELSQILRDQRLSVLSLLDNLIESLGLYTALDGGFGWWQGDPAPALRAFGAASAADLEAYLETERQIVDRLSSEYGDPLLAMFGADNRLVPLRELHPASKWLRIASDLTAYRNKQAGNPLARLEELINTLALNEPMGSASDSDDAEESETSSLSALEQKPAVFDLFACFNDELERTVLRPSPSSGDFFMVRRQFLRDALVERCGRLADARAFEKYRQLAGCFNQRLSGKFPFAEPEAEGDASPDDIRDFFNNDFEQVRILVDNLPSPSLRFGSKKQAVEEFLVRMEDVRGFFSSFLAPEARTKVPLYDLAVRFRIERTREQGANQIISWLLSVGEPATKEEPSWNGERIIDLLTTDSVTPTGFAEGPLEPAARWIFQRPVTLTFRWATGSSFSPTLPIQPEGSEQFDPQQLIIDGRTLTYRYRGPWSLLRLLTEHRAPVEEFPDLRDPRPETIKLSINTVSDARPEPRAVANLYLQIALLSADENKRLTLPSFPTLQAPVVGSTSDPVAPCVELPE